MGLFTRKTLKPSSPLIAPIPWEDLEFVGMNGRMRGACGRSSPVVHSKSQGLYGLYKKDMPIEAWLHTSEEKISIVESERRITRIPPVSAFPDAIVLYIGKEILAEIGKSLTDITEGIEPCCWQMAKAAEDLVHHREKHPIQLTEAYVTYCTMGDGAAVLHRLESIIMEEAKIELQKAAETAQAPHAERSLQLANSAICAAISPEARREVHLAKGRSLLLLNESEGVKTFHRLIVAREFPGWEWPDYLRECRDA